MESGYRGLMESAGYLRRDDRGRLSLRGADRLSYLHGLLTNDIAALTPGVGCYAALLTPQGRMIADMQVVELGDLLLLVLERDVTETVREHLDRFVITEDVTIEDVSSSLAQIGLYGARAAAVLADVLARGRGGPEAPPTEADLDALAPLASRRWQAGAVSVTGVRSRDAGVPGFDLFVSAEHADTVIGSLREAGALEIALADLDVTRIEAGIPRFGRDMDTTTIPLEAGIEDDAISMTKGCYVGQEVIVRVLHRGGGRVAKKLVQLKSEGEVREGDVIFSGDREIGRVTSAAPSPRFGGYRALGYVHRDFVDTGTPVVVGTGRIEATVV